MQHTTSSRDTILASMKPGDETPVGWQRVNGLMSYEQATARMEDLVDKVSKGEAAETVLLVEHPALYTGGTSATKSDLLDISRFPVHQTGRGGEYTYHGPGQRVVYPILDLTKRVQDVRLYVAMLEQWIINTLAEFNIRGERREDRVGVWVARPEKPALPDGTMREDKIAAIGIRLRKWVTFHGISINVEPDLEHYSGIVPCGVEGHGVTSLVDLGLPVMMEDMDLVLRQQFELLFGPTIDQG